MKLTKAETNNAIIAKLEDVRKHGNADRLKIATVCGNTVIVGLDAKDGDMVVYFDSNLKLSQQYLSANNLYSESYAGMNSDPTKWGYFGKSGRVKAQRFRGEISNGYPADLESLTKAVLIKYFNPKVGDVFTHINGVEICSKYIVGKEAKGQKTKKPKSWFRRLFPKKPKIYTDMFWKHWDTAKLMMC